MADKEKKVNYADPSYYWNRELSWLQFNRRCLAEARNKENPLLERLKFLSITASNLDEFFMVRVASLQDMVNADYRKKDIAGMSAQEQLDAVIEDTHTFVGQQYWTLNHQLLPAMEQNDITLVSMDELTEAERSYLDDYFESDVFPVLTPMAVDTSRPFPLIRGKSLNLGALLTRRENAGPGILTRTKKAKKAIEGGREEIEFATVQVPSVLPRVILLPREEGVKQARILLLEELIRSKMDSLFLNYDVVCAYPYRIMRNADMDIDEDEAEDLLKEIEKQLKKRQRGEAIRLEVEKGMDPRMLEFLQSQLGLEKSKVYEIDGPIDLTFLMKAYGVPGYDELREHRYAKPQEVPELSAGCDIFAQIRKGDIFMHHPYQSFQPVVDFVRQAAEDPDVLAIKQTLYRVSGNSPIVAALAKAADNGKQVTVLVELKARFDEEHNIVWARMLEKAGAHVIYGLVGLKTHSKITLVVRREEDGIRRYVHLATGNYNDSTAKLYTDVGMFTCREEYGEDATSAFNMLSGYSEPRHWNRLTLAPLWLKDRFLYLIGRERDNAKSGEKGYIKAKMNALCDPDIIKALYEASAAGVRIDLIVRGICCLKVGVPGVSENIHVRSIVGNFLEHSRIYWFYNAGRPEMFCASADWMPRNLDRRVEIMFPLVDEGIKQKAEHILDVELQDTVKAQEMCPDGSYKRVDRRGKDLIDSQLVFCDEAVEIAKKSRQDKDSRVFTPETAPETDD